MNSSVIVIYNPTARRASGKTIKAASAFFERQGYATEILCTGSRGEAEAFARRAVLKKPHLIIAAGGDGTINEVINGMAFSGVSLGILPLGTTNVLAREIYPKRDLITILHTLITSQSRPISLGRITCLSKGVFQTRYFCLMAGVGFDGQAVRDVNLKLKKRTGPGAYILSGLHTLLSYAPHELTISLDGQTVCGYAAIIGNISRYGGDFKITPDARIEETSLYVCIFQGKKRSDLLRYVGLMPFGRHIRARDVLYRRVEEIVICGAAPVQIDGDYLCETPATITVVRNAIRLVC
ncbi:MAG: hypothetical protein C0402_02085 [Thermodesulfovibrio sp.]|nr:hypothetical protein [Thermodesulfovibrio sp.]